MYYPYLRGKHIIPVIEPVHSNSGFALFLEKTKGFRSLIIANPQVGLFLFYYSNLNDDSLKERMYP